MHEVADLPHEALVAIDDRLGTGAILVKTGRGHLLLDLADCRFGLGDPGFERRDPRLASPRGLLFLSRFGVDAFLFVVILMLLREREAFPSTGLGTGSRALRGRLLTSISL
jgi:hypothetical protein